MPEIQSDYHRAQSLLFAATQYRKQGMEQEARACFHDAAVIEEAHVRSLDPEAKPRSVAIYGATAAWAFYHAGEPERAAALVRDFGAVGERCELVRNDWAKLERLLENADE